MLFHAPSVGLKLRIEDSDALTDGFKMRRGAIEAGVSLITDIKTAIFACTAMHRSLRRRDFLGVRAVLSRETLRKWVRESSGKPFWDLSSWQEHVEIVERLV